MSERCRILVRTPFASLFLAIYFALLATSAQAQADDPFRAAAGTLDLSNAQIKALAEVQEQAKGKFHGLHATMRQTRQKFEAALLDDKATPDQLAYLQRSMIEARTKLMQAQFDRMMQVRGILNKDQLKEFLAKVAQHRKDRHGHEKRTEGSSSSESG